MKKVFLFTALGTAGLVAAFFLPGTVQSPENKFEPLILNSESYQTAADVISKQINDLSPTPPTEATWVVTAVEFVKSEPYGYVTYHDTHNLFRILVETGKGNRYRTVATFQPSESGWRLANGQDLATGRETVRISPN